MKLRHFKGGEYHYIGLGMHTETHEKLEIYKNTSGEIYARPVEMFHEEVEVNGELVPRFTPVQNSISLPEDTGLDALLNVYANTVLALNQMIEDKGYDHEEVLDKATQRYEELHRVDFIIKNLIKGAEVLNRISSCNPMYKAQYDVEANKVVLFSNTEPSIPLGTEPLSVVIDYIKSNQWIFI